MARRGRPGLVRQGQARQDGAGQAWGFQPLLASQTNGKTPQIR